MSKPKLLDQVRDAIRVRHYSMRTEEAYIYLIKRFIFFHDIDFSYNQIVGRDGKGGKDQLTMLSGSLKEPLRKHLEKVRILHEQDLKEGFGKVYCLLHLQKNIQMLKENLPGNIALLCKNFFF